jgi:hypothetical protein
VHVARVCGLHLKFEFSKSYENFRSGYKATTVIDTHSSDDWYLVGTLLVLYHKSLQNRFINLSYHIISYVLAKYSTYIGKDDYDIPCYSIV